MKNMFFDFFGAYQEGDAIGATKGYTTKYNTWKKLSRN
jgi:hypothetical protein